MRTRINKEIFLIKFLTLMNFPSPNAYSEGSGGGGMGKGVRGYLLNAKRLYTDVSGFTSASRIFEYPCCCFPGNILLVISWPSTDM